MSIGDLKTDGLKGNNFPWQLKMLKGLQGIINAIIAITPTPPTPALSKVPVIERQSGAGAISGVTNSISFAVAVTAATYSTISTDGGTTYINVLPGETVIYDAGVLNNYFEDRIFYYDATGSDLLITYITP